MSAPPTPPTPSGSRRSPVMVALGWLLVILGGLWTALAGLCTGAFVVMGAGNRGVAGVWVGFLVIGAICIAPGAAMLFGGVIVLREQRRLGRS